MNFSSRHLVAQSLFGPSLFILLIFSTPLFANTKPPLSHMVQDFRLLNTNGKLLSLQSYPDAKGFIIIFTCNHCPFAKLYPSRLNTLNEKYSAIGVPLLAINSIDTTQYEDESFREMVDRAKMGSFNFPYLVDGSQKVAKNFSAEKTPHAYVIWKEKEKWRIRYNGAIDDNAAEPEKVQSHYLADAVDSLLAGADPVMKETQSIGCQIYFRSP